MELIMTYSKVSLLIVAILLQFHGSIQQVIPLGIKLGDQTCTAYIENILGDQELRPPKSVNVFFKVFSRNNTNGTDLLRGSNRDRSFQSFNPELYTRFIIHEFMSRPTANWIVALREALLKREDCNIITVDWSREAVSPYQRAVLRAPLVGEKVGNLIQSLMDRRGANPNKMHLIGLSLGAQIAGLAGQRIYKIDRITGLDPAAPLFGNVSDLERLDPSDANFVDIIHTNADCLGAGWQCGHVDFYPNGGAEQPGCKRVDYNNTDVRLVVRTAICSHLKAADYFIESILSNNDSRFMGSMSDSYQDFLMEKPNFLNETNTCPMGINADTYHSKGKPFDGPRKFYL